MASQASKNIRKISYAKYGYMFIIPFFLVYAVFQLYPLIYTFYLSVMHEDKSGALQFFGLDNFQNILVGTGSFTAKAIHSKFIMSLQNTMVLWIWNFIPQLVLSILLAVWFTDSRLHVKGTGFFKVLMYMPNIITAASVASLFLRLCGNDDSTIINAILLKLNIIDDPISFTKDAAINRGMISFIQTWMWYGNTMILVISGILGINPSLYEAANIDGANSTQVFTKITVPLLRPILVYTVITSMIGGLQMFDIPLLYNDGTAQVPDGIRTIAIFIYERYSGTMKDYGTSAAASVILFVLTGALGVIIFFINRDKDAIANKKRLKKLKKQMKQTNKGFGGLEI